MTIPIKPGPFSFLVPLGEGLGRGAQVREERRRYDREDARQAAAFLIAMREKGILDPAAFADPNITQVFDAAGFAAPSVEPTFGEMKERAGRGMMRGEEVPIEQRLAAGLPRQSEVEAEKFSTSKGKMANQVMETGTPEQRELLTQIPSPISAQTQVLSQRNPVLMENAKRYVAGALSMAGGRVPSDRGQISVILADAYARYRQEAESDGIAPQPLKVFKSYFDAALLDYSMIQQELDSKRLAASNRGGADDTYRYLNSINQFMQQMRQYRADKADMLKSIPALVAWQRAKGYRTLDEARAALQGEIDGLDQIISASTQGFTATIGNAPNPAGRAGSNINTARLLSDEEVTSLAEMLRNGQATLQNLEDLVAAGHATEADRQKIKELLARPRTHADPIPMRPQADTTRPQQ